VNGDLRQQFLALLEKAPDIEAALDEQTGLWTVVLPPPTDRPGCRAGGKREPG
jgi:hypothetical protein